MRASRGGRRLSPATEIVAGRIILLRGSKGIRKVPAAQGFAGTFGGYNVYLDPNISLTANSATNPRNRANSTVRPTSPTVPAGTLTPSPT